MYKSSIVVFTLFILLGAIALVSSGCRCDPPNCRTETRCDRNGNCETVKVRRWLVDPNLQGLSGNPGEYAGVIDLAKAWRPNASGSSTLSIKFTNAAGQQTEQSFALSYDPTLSQTIPPVDKDTIPYAFTINDPGTITGFVNGLAGSGFSDSDAEITFSIPITQIECSAPSGKYINHTRIKDSSGITYDHDFIINYTAPANINAGCNQGSLVIE